MSSNISQIDPTEPAPCRKTPRKAASSVALPVPLQEAVIRVARKQERSFSAVVRIALQNYVKRAENEPAA